VSSQETDFIGRVCKRDIRCCLTGKEVPFDVQTKFNFFGFEVAQIFPLSASNEVRDLILSLIGSLKLRKFYYRFSRYITDPDVGEDDKMNSIQQGFLVCSDLRGRFDNYEVGVDPDVSLDAFCPNGY
jgi:hypothetical protein